MISELKHMSDKDETLRQPTANTGFSVHCSPFLVKFVLGLVLQEEDTGSVKTLLPHDGPVNLLSDQNKMLSQSFFPW